MAIVTNDNSDLILWHLDNQQSTALRTGIEIAVAEGDMTILDKSCMN